MSDSNNSLYLEQELRKLKSELAEKEADLAFYKEELDRINQGLSKLLMGLDQDLTAIRTVFKYLVPSRFPHISGFKFSTKYISGMRFNGDYIDVFEQKDKFKFNLIMSTTSGPALTALLIGFLLKFGRDFGEVKGVTDPTEFLSRVLKQIEDKEENPSDIQLACALINKRTYEMECKVHGGVKCYHQKGDQIDQVHQVGGKGETEKIKLNAYDRFLMVSPGLLGAMNQGGEAFGHSPILDSMKSIPLTQSVHDLRNDILYKLDRHLGGRKPMQDVSLIIVSVDNNVIKLV
jgi:serine phosphatase RsbU (regulator of sigma subunit)